MRSLLTLAHARRACASVNRLKVAWRALRDWWAALVLRSLDRYLAERDEERVPVPLDFEELEVQYDEADIPVLFGEAGGWAGNP